MHRSIGGIAARIIRGRPAAPGRIVMTQLPALLQQLPVEGSGAASLQGGGVDKGREKRMDGHTLKPNGHRRRSESAIKSSMNSATTEPLAHQGTSLPWRVAPPLISTALTMIGSGFLGTLLPLRFSAMGLSDGVIG